MNGFARFRIGSFRLRSLVGVLPVLLVTIVIPGTAAFGAETPTQSNHSPPPSPQLIERQLSEAEFRERDWVSRENQEKIRSFAQDSWNPAPAGRPLRIVFPANPPPLGEPLKPWNDAAIPADAEIAALLGETLEPYFAPLSTHLIEPDKKIKKPLQDRLQAYRDSRHRLLTGLRDRITALIAADAATRQQELSALELLQRADLEKLEVEAEKLRAELTRKISWFAQREWRLGKGDLKRPREQLRKLESQLLRAAAYYQDGLSPAQRRLGLEAALLLDTPVPTENEMSESSRALLFFSPDLLRMPSPAGATTEVASTFRQYCAAKDALREQLRNAIYESEVESDSARLRKFQRLAIEQEPKLSALDDLANSIRSQLAASPSFRRASPPRQLPPDLEGRIAEYTATKQKILMDYLAVMRSVVATLPAADPGDAASRIRRQERIEKAKSDYLAKQAATMQHLDRLLRETCSQLSRVVAAEEPSAAAISDDAQLLEFVGRHRQEQAAYEFDLAAFEPGLSPAQRRLLFAGAVVRLDLPFGGTEFQPTVLPKPFLP